jgi:hypothetical protein
LGFVFTSKFISTVTNLLALILHEVVTTRDENKMLGLYASHFTALPNTWVYITWNGTEREGSGCGLIVLLG